MTNLYQTTPSRADTPNVRDAIVVLARLLLSLLFLIDGFSKLGGLDGTINYLISKGVPFPGVVAALTTTLEIGGGLLILLGGGTSFVACILATYCLVTAYVGHPFWNLSEAGPRMNHTYHFWKNVGLCGAFMLLHISGSGYWSLDAWMRRRVA